MLFFNGATGNCLRRLSGLLSFASDVTIMARSRYDAPTSVGDTTTVWVMTTQFSGAAPDYSHVFLWHGYTDGNLIEFEVFNTQPESQYGPVLTGQCYWTALTYDALTKTFQFFVNGAPTVNTVFDMSPTPVVGVLLGSDFENVGIGHSVGYYREWQAKLNANEIAAEMVSETAVRRANLWTDTPLLTIGDLSDKSGNGHNWSKNGSPTSTTSCTSVPNVTPVPVPLAPQAPCVPQAQISGGGKGQFGCNRGGVGWVSGYSGPYGAAPLHDDPADGERF